jgi:hypothetical protein
LARAEAVYLSKYPANPRDWICLAHVVAAVAADMTEAEAAEVGPRLREHHAAATYVYGRPLPAPAIRRLLHAWARDPGSGWVRFVVDAVPSDADDASLRGAWHDALLLLEVCDGDFDSLPRLRKLGERDSLRVALCGWVERLARSDVQSHALLVDHGGPECVAAMYRAHERSLSDPTQIGILYGAFAAAEPGSEAMAALGREARKTLLDRLEATPLSRWREALALEVSLDALSFSISLSGAAMAPRADNLGMDRLHLALSIQRWPAEWCRIELTAEWKERTLIRVRNDEAVFCEERMGLGAPTLHALPAWLGALTRDFEVHWEKPLAVAPQGVARDLAAVLAWLLDGVR